MKINVLRASLNALLVAGVLGRLSAQTPPAASSSEEVLQLEKLSVNGVAPEKQILPTARPFSSVFGTDDIIIDVPRNVTIISTQQLSDINISSVLDFTKLTSSSYTTTNFGAPSNPSIRGQTADLFINGVRGRITSNGNGLPLDFNSVESVNILKGPATAGSGVTGKLSTITRSDGTKQATYDGHPLYTYAGDTAPGQAKGNGLNASGGLWYEMTVSGATPAAGAGASASATSTKGGYGY